ncbi:MAG: hypothetical protein NT025_08440 [bacterium]|nr:hypothetical protein [bacterium]
MKTPILFRAMRVPILTSLLMLAFASEGLCQSQQEKFSQMVQVWNIFRTIPDYAGENFDYYWEVFVEAGDIGAYEDTIAQLCKLGIDQSVNRDCRSTSLKILVRLNDPQNHAYIESLVSDSQLVSVAAGAAIKWGQWDLCAPILADASAYWSLGDDPRAVPLIMAGIASSDLARRYEAADALARRHGDSSYLLPAARALVMSDVWEGPTLRAMELLKASADVADVEALEEAATNGKDASLRSWAVRYLGDVAHSGKPYARAALERVRENSIGMDIREQAEIFLHQLDTLK